MLDRVGKRHVLSRHSPGSPVQMVRFTGSNFKVDIPLKFPRLRRDVTVKVAG